MSISELCQGLARTGTEVTVYTTTANGENELPVTPGESVEVDDVTVIYFKRITGDHSHFSPRLLKKLFGTCRDFDVVHIHSWWNLVAVLAVLVCWLRGVRPVFSPRGMISDYSFTHKNSGIKHLFHRTFGKFLLSRTILHATSEMEERECRALIPQWRSFVLYNFVKLNGRGNRPSEPFPAVLRIGFLSRIDRKKGLELLFKAVRDARIPCRLYIAGDGDPGYLASLKRLASDLGLGDQVEWLGWLKGEEKAKFYSSIDAFALTSYNENFANVVIEALGAGCPVLVSNRVGVADFVASKELGWVCSLDTNDITVKLQDIVNQAVRRKEIESRAPGVIEHIFSPGNLSRQYLNQYAGLIQNSPAFVS